MLSNLQLACSNCNRYWLIIEKSVVDSFSNECTKVQNPRRHDHELDLSVYNTACANSRMRGRYRNLRVTGSIRKTFSQRRRLKRKKLAALLSSRIPGSV